MKVKNKTTKFTNKRFTGTTQKKILEEVWIKKNLVNTLLKINQENEKDITTFYDGSSGIIKC